MKEKIYKAFTREGGVMLSPEALEYLEGSIRGEAMLKGVSTEYIRRNGPELADLCLIREIVESFDAKQDIYNILNQEFREPNSLLKYRRLVEKMGREITPIYLLGDECSTIFGCYYKDKDGREVLEDDGDVIPLDMSGCSGDVFLCDNIFIGIEGKKTDGRFVGLKVHLPGIDKGVCRMPRLAEKDLKVLFFSDFQMSEINGRILRKILSKVQADIVVIMGKLCLGRLSSISYTNFVNGFRLNGIRTQVPDIILCPDADDVYPSFLPKEIQVPEECSKVIKAASNPFTLETRRCSIGVIREDIFKYKERGVFIGRNYVDSFVETVLSQSSFNPFGISNLDVDRTPDVFVVGQDFYPFVTSVKGVTFISCPSFKDEMSFVSYDLSSGDATVLNSKHVLT
ncbi:hypothetical protein [Encephalitozoon cuniculi GB-M1]|uniref:Uncharacterized protein n=2 Tax=Encephalitozoon cuniculi TaxID=6035 RepID=Q8SVM4_ENCCU|nr:uncharacterized protein ECU05_0330 [Encephalitozoon cuniculi GB-M1]KMV66086.1 DNA polymerase alpha/epsilon-like protein [Encephalitozoon cuniculi EcunIII-L]UYI27821.1 putative DNA polymerase epsilon subunit 2 [Encephalitozoon cuniculi]CAD26550.2 hypothetical protein [Encephalitozoon cuniculi GB-M1]